MDAADRNVRVLNYKERLYINNNHFIFSTCDRLLLGRREIEARQEWEQSTTEAVPAMD